MAAPPFQSTLLRAPGMVFARHLVALHDRQGEWVAEKDEGKMKIRICCVAALLACALMNGNAFGADKETLTDQEFLKQAMAAGNAEVQFGQLAEKRASNEKVREFAKEMVTDHKDANKKLAEHAKNLKIAVVVGGLTLDKDRREIYKQLSKLEGKEFDQEYIKQMVKDHEEAIKLFEKQAKSGTDPDLKKYASDTLPTLKKHLEHARKVAAELKG
jgi:putative membrane protein